MLGLPSSHGLRGGDPQEAEPVPDDVSDRARQAEARAAERGFLGPHDPESRGMGAQMMVRVELRRQFKEL